MGRPEAFESMGDDRFEVMQRWFLGKYKRGVAAEHE